MLKFIEEKLPHRIDMTEWIWPKFGACDRKIHTDEYQHDEHEQKIYRLAFQLYKIYNQTIDNEDWIDMNIQQNFDNRNKFIQLTDNSILRIIKNMMTDRLKV